MTTPPVGSAEADAPPVSADEFIERMTALRAELQKAVLGQERVVDALLTALFAQGHALIIGVPGLAKTICAEIFG